MLCLCGSQYHLSLYWMASFARSISLICWMQIEVYKQLCRKVKSEHFWVHVSMCSNLCRKTQRGYGHVWFKHVRPKVQFSGPVSL